MSPFRNDGMPQASQMPSFYYTNAPKEGSRDIKINGYKKSKKAGPTKFVIPYHHHHLKYSMKDRNTFYQRKIAASRKPQASDRTTWRGLNLTNSKLPLYSCKCRINQNRKVVKNEEGPVNPPHTIKSEKVILNLTILQGKSTNWFFFK